MNLLAQTDSSFWMPPDASSYAGVVDWLFYVILWICAVMFALIVAWMGVFIWRYRHRPGHKAVQTAAHSTAIELTWTIVPTIVVMFVFYYGFRGFLKMSVPPPDAYEVQATAFKWGWEFTYPNGHVDPNLHLPLGRPVRLVLSSRDVIHSLYVPAFRAKKDVVPGRYNKLWFSPTKTGEFPLFCAEYCGTKHSEMIAKVHVHEPHLFVAWLEEAANWIDRVAPAEAGAKLFHMRGCAQCHSADGQGSIGPTFLNLFGATHPLADGSSITVDENYVRTSILDPGSQVAAGFDNVMPTFQGRLKENEIAALIAYLKSISEHVEQPSIEESPQPPLEPEPQTPSDRSEQQVKVDAQGASSP